MKLLKIFLKVLIFTIMFVTWSYVFFLLMIILTDIFKQKYFLMDINLLLTSQNEFNFCYFTWILLLFNFIFSILFAYYYSKDTVNMKPSHFSSGSSEKIKNITILVIMIFLIAMSKLLAKTNSNSIFFIFVASVFSVIPLNYVYNWIEKRSNLIIKLLSKNVYSKFEVNHFDFSQDEDLIFWAQNKGGKKDKFNFKGLCRLNDFERIRKRKKDSNHLIFSPFESHWVELEPQDTMPKLNINKLWLKYNLGLICSDICIMYENVAGKLYKENLVIDNYNKAMKSYPEGKKIDWITFLGIFFEDLFIYFLAYCFSSYFLYTLSFVIFLFFIVLLVAHSLNETNTSKIILVTEYENNHCKFQIQNNTRKRAILNLEILINDKIIFSQKNIDINKREISHIISCSNIKFQNIKHMRVKLHNTVEKDQILIYKVVIPNKSLIDTLKK